jgi:hypothetical protein
MAIRPFAATGTESPSRVKTSDRRDVECASGRGAPPGTRLEAFVNYTCGGQNIQLFIPPTYAYTEPATNFDFHVPVDGAFPPYRKGSRG